MTDYIIVELISSYADTIDYDRLEMIMGSPSDGCCTTAALVGRTT